MPRFLGRSQLVGRRVEANRSVKRRFTRTNDRLNLSQLVLSRPDVGGKPSSVQAIHLLL